MTERSAARRMLLVDAPDEALEDEIELREHEAAAEAVALPILRPTLWERIREAWDSRYLLRPLMFFSIQTFRGRILGRGWIFLRPFMQVFGFSLLLGGVFGAKAPNGIPYLVFLIFSMQAYRLFDLTTYYGTMATKMFRRLTQPLRVPLLLIPIANLARVGIVLAVYWGLAAVVLVYYLFATGHFYLQVDAQLLAGFAGLALCLLWGLAISLTTSVIFPRARDMKYFVRYGMQLLMFVTPVLYSAHHLSPTYAKIAQINPIAPPLGLVQYGFINAGAPSLYGVAWSVFTLLLVGLFGLWFFNRNANKWIGVYRVSEDDDDDDDDSI